MLFILLLAVMIPQAGAQDDTAQAGQQPAQNTATPDGSSGGLFGGNTNLESGVQSKGAEVGVGQTGKQPVNRPGEFAFAPIPLLNPSIGNGMGGAAMYIVPIGSAPAPPSVFTLGGFGTGTGSWSLGLGTRLYLKGDRYRITAGYGGGTFNYNFFGVGPEAGSQGLAIPLSQRSRAYLIEPKKRFFGNWFIGPRYHHIGNHIRLNEDKFKGQGLAVPLPAGLGLTTAALGLRVTRDTTDSPFYPRRGSVVDITLDFFDAAFGAQLSYQNVNVAFNKYISVGDKNVIATHLASCVVTNGAPFFDVCLLGQSKDLRGYQMGRYRDNRMLDGQAEFRR